MSIFFKISFFLIVFINLINLFLTNYIHEDLDGNLIGDKSSNFSLFIKNFIGMVFYAIDENGNKILIEIEEKHSERKLFFKFNNYLVNEKSENLCGCFQCDVYITIILHLKENKIVIECNNKKQVLKINKSKIFPNQLNSYPVPMKYGERNNRTFIWMGNIGQYNGKNGMEYQPLKNQLFGCLDVLYFNGKLIKIKSNGPKFNSSCPTQYDETVCRNKICINSTVSYNIKDCSINSLNRRYCTKDLHQFNKTISNRIIELNDESILTRLEWILNSETRKQHCLAEFKFYDGFLVLFYINSYRHLILTKGYFKNDPPESEELNDLSSKNSHIMLVSINKTEFTIRLSNNEKINTIIFTINSSLISIKVGIATNYGLCREFKGLMEFQYKKELNSQTSKRSPEYLKISSKKNNYEDYYTTGTEFPIEKNNSTIIKPIYNADKKEINTATILLIASALVLFFIILLAIFYISIKKEMRSSMKRIQLTPINSIIRDRSTSRNMPLPNIYEYEDPITMSNHTSEYYEIIDN